MRIISFLLEYRTIASFAAAKTSVVIGGMPFHVERSKRVVITY
jgi:hypothetical protein